MTEMNIDALALQLTQRIEEEISYDRPGGQTRATIQSILAKAITSRLASALEERDALLASYIEAMDQRDRYARHWAAAEAKLRERL